MKLLIILLFLSLTLGCSSATHNRKPNQLKLNQNSESFPVERMDEDSTLSFVLNTDILVKKDDSKSVKAIFQNGEMRICPLHCRNPETTSESPYCEFYFNQMRKRSSGEPLAILKNSVFKITNTASVYTQKNYSADNYTFDAKPQIINGREVTPYIRCIVDKPGSIDSLRLEELRAILGDHMTVLLDFEGGVRAAPLDSSRESIQ